jgi:hypothetical protein
MRWIVLIFGVPVVLGLTAVSVVMNFRFGLLLGRSEGDGLVYAFASGCADIFKGVHIDANLLVHKIDKFTDYVVETFAHCKFNVCCQTTGHHSPTTSHILEIWWAHKDSNLGPAD